MSTVTAIRLYKPQSDLFKVDVDGKFAFSLSGLDISNTGLREGDELSADRLTELIELAGSGKAYAEALKFVSHRLRSVREVSDYLKRRGHVAEPVRLAIDKLGELGVLDDSRFAEAWVNDRTALRPRSRRQLEFELTEKGISRNIIDETLLGLERSTYLDSLCGVIRKKRYRYGDEKKLIAYLSRQGYAYDDIRAALTLAAEDTSSVES